MTTETTVTRLRPPPHLIVIVGLAWPWLRRIPLFRLPGDVVIDRPGFRLFLPFTTMIVVSLLASLILWLLRK